MKKLTSILLALVMLLSLCACGSVSRDVAAVETAAAEPAEMNYGAQKEEAGGIAMSNYATADMEGETDTAHLPEDSPEKIIYSADATVETTHFEDTLTKVAAMVDEYGGWIQSSSVNGANYYNTARGRVSYRSAYYTMRIPSARFNELMNSLSALGNVPYTYTYTENVTSQYYDTQARLTAYQTQETRLLEMMEIAETVEDIITIEEKLTELRYQIEALQSTLNNWDRKVSYSTVNLSIEEVEEYTPESAASPSYGQRLLNSLEDSLHGIGSFFANFLIWIVGALPVLLILAVILYVLIVVIKRARKKRKAKNALKDNSRE